MGSQAARYVAVVAVPAGGIAAIAIGLEGYRSLPGQASTRTDVFFPIANDPFSLAKASLAPTSSAAGASAPWIPLAAGLAVLGMLVKHVRIDSVRAAVLPAFSARLLTEPLVWTPSLVGGGIRGIRWK